MPVSKTFCITRTEYVNKSEITLIAIHFSLE